MTVVTRTDMRRLEDALHDRENPHHLFPHRSDVSRCGIHLSELLGGCPGSGEAVSLAEASRPCPHCGYPTCLTCLARYRAFWEGS